MCRECVELEKQVERYREITKTEFDVLTVERVDELIVGLRRRKRTLHSFGNLDPTRTSSVKGSSEDAPATTSTACIL
jgi:hypothetical protein